jgi:hypothetical protein
MNPRTLDPLPPPIEQLERKSATRTAALNDPEFFQQDGSAIMEANKMRCGPTWILRTLGGLNWTASRWTAWPPIRVSSSGDTGQSLG